MARKYLKLRSKRVGKLRATLFKWYFAADYGPFEVIVAHEDAEGRAVQVGKSQHFTSRTDAFRYYNEQVAKAKEEADVD